MSSTAPASFTAPINTATLALAQVRDMDCVVSFVPLILDMPSPHREVSGPAAIIRRWVYALCRDISTPLLDLDGWRCDAASLTTLQSECEGVGRILDYVQGCSVDLSYDDVAGSLTVSGILQLVDGLVYVFEVVTAAAPAAILAMGPAS